MLTVSATPAECIELVQGSPAAVAAHDKKAWMGLFSRYSLVEDPVGSRPCVSRPGDDPDKGPLSRFYDTFIAPNTIRFNVDRDMVGGSTVVRDLSLQITMADGSNVVTPMHLLYELVEEGGELRIFRLAAHWELRETLRQRTGGMGAFWRMLKFLGVGGVVGFMRALSSVGEDGKSRVREFQRAFNQRQGDALMRLFTDKQLEVRLRSAGETLALSELLNLGNSISLGKTLAAGSTVSSSFELTWGSQVLKGVAFFHFERKGLLVAGLDIYWST